MAWASARPRAAGRRRTTRTTTSAPSPPPHPPLHRPPHPRSRSPRRRPCTSRAPSRRRSTTRSRPPHSGRPRTAPRHPSSERRRSPLRGIPREVAEMKHIHLGHLVEDLRAGAITGLVSVPIGLATGLLAGVSPISGLYGAMLGTFSGALSTGSVFMAVQGTGAMAVIIAEVPQLHGDDRAGSLAMLGVL